jgi:serine/threonine protein kinase/Tol biopolymer transport system component
MPFYAGERVGPYEIVSAIGSGGMGEVYKARDTRLGRDVAIKVSTVAFSERFEREGRAVAALNHPNICQLYDVGALPSGSGYLVMEYVEGERLQGPMPVKDVLRIARQIASALEDAHERGIVHRDLKPGNILMRADGTVKVLDFGLAKAAGVSDVVTENSPTRLRQGSGEAADDRPLTQSGMILGTAAYMAPEQARGRDVDKRADIWAFGVVLHELLTGRRLFGGDDLAGILAMVLKEQPDLSDVPAEVRPLLAKCLEKDPKHRLRDIGDFELLIGAPPATPLQSAAARWPWIVAGLAGVVAAAALAVLWLRQPALEEARQIQFALEPPPGTQFNNGPNAMTPSPDGRLVVFGAGDSRDTSALWLRPLDALTARPLPGTEGGSFTFWSPDSKSLAFTAGGKLKRIAIAGGPAVTLADSNGSPVTPIGAWNEDGVILFGSREGLRRVSASGGESTLITKIDPDRKETGHGFPQFLPGGKRFLYFVGSTDPEVRGVYASSLEDLERRQRILRTSSKAFYAPPRGAYGGYLLWLQEQTLLAQRFDADSLRLEGEPAAIAENIALGQLGPVRAAYWVSDAGVLVYFGGAELDQHRIVWMTRDGRPLGDAVPPDRFGALALSPGGERIVFERTVREAGSSTANPDLWLWTVAQKLMTKLTFDRESDKYPIWSPDGQRIVFTSNRIDGIPQIYRKDASGAGGEERLTEGPNGKITMDWSRDGRHVLYREIGPRTGMDLWALPLDGPGALKPFPLAVSQFNEGGGRFSPDGKWLAYNSNETGTSQVFVQAFPPAASGSGGKWQISQNGGQEMRWRSDGRELYWNTSDGKVFAAEILVGPRGIQSGTPHELFTAPMYTATAGSFDVTDDGQRFLVLLFASQGEGSIRLNVVSNWQAGLPR